MNQTEEIERLKKVIVQLEETLANLMNYSDRLRSLLESLCEVSSGKNAQQQPAGPLMCVNHPDRSAVIVDITLDMPYSSARGLCSECCYEKRISERL